MASIAGSTQADSGDITDNSSNGGGATTTVDVAARVRAFLVESFLLGDDDGFADDESLLDAGIVDSTGVMEVVTFLEETFSITIDDEELIADNLDSVDRLAAFVQRKRG
jgi:acyl carrier protein